jgi:hypothetical protein
LAVDAAGFLYDPDQDIIYSRMDALQRRLGYAYGYDAAAITMSMVIDCEPIFFDYAGKHWMIELWKGQYGLETGCEIGVYTRPIGSTGVGYQLLDSTVGRRPGDNVASHNLFYDCAADGDRLTLSATLNRNGQKLFTLGPELHWWLTGFKWGVYSEPGDLTVDVSITLKDNAMLQAFMGGIQGRNYPNLKTSGTTVSFTFDKTRTPQPPKPGLALAQAWNHQIVNTYDALHFKNNDPNQVQAEFLNVVLGLLHLPDSWGQVICQLAVEAGQGIASVVAGLVDGLGAAASTIEAWWSGVSQAFESWATTVESYLGINLDFACYVEVDNTRGHSALVLKGSTAQSGSYVVAPPHWIPKGKTARFILQDAKGQATGSEGAAYYSYADANLTLKNVFFFYEDPFWVGQSNVAVASQTMLPPTPSPDWVTFARTDTGHPWSTPVPKAGHPLYVGFVTGGGQPG